MDKLPLYKMFIADDFEGEEEVDFVALVESPAIQRNFLAFAEGVAHYTADGKLYTGPMHKDASGKLMTGAVHTADSEYLYHLEELAEIKVIVCKECGHSWDYQEGGKDPYTCHMCGADNTPKEEAFESYSDYPDGVKGNAKNVLEYTEANGWGSCGTPVGKQRANQLANGEPISLDTIQRMYSYLSRHEVDIESSTAYGDGCGKLMYDAWGGKAALGWSRNKLRELGQLEAEFSTKLKFAVQDEDQRIVSGPLMIADLPIYRKDEEGEYYVMFTGEQIKKIVQRFFKKGYQAKVNIEHGKKAEGVYMFESYIIDRERGVNPPKDFEDVADGSWFGSFKVENEKLWNEVKAGTFKGFSVEGLFRYEKAGMIVQKEEQIMSQIFKILSQIEQE
jgi:hypothetical protein